MRAPNKQYTPEFRADAVSLVHRGDRSLRQVAEDLGINHWTLREWFREGRMKRDTPKGTSVAEATPAAETPASSA